VDVVVVLERRAHPSQQVVSKAVTTSFIKTESQNKTTQETNA
jgi:hypothetical protein